MDLPGNRMLIEKFKFFAELVQRAWGSVKVFSGFWKPQP